MFKKLKDKLAEEVKSSPQRIQQFAQAAQAAVTSASSSVSDITNNDLFSIGDTDPQKSSRPLQLQKEAFQDINLASPSSFTSSTDISDHHLANDSADTSRQRRLSNSSFASDVSFKLPSYESPSMYHLQSDVDVSASEAEERGFSSPGISLDRVTKEQLYAAYKRTHDRYGKYRSQYADLARHYKLLERENAKARSVLVETQDKALRRISELREQCSLEQSAKAHLEKALRMEIEEKNIKVETLTTKVKLLQSDSEPNSEEQDIQAVNKIENTDTPLIDLSLDVKPKVDTATSDLTTLNVKIEKLEQLNNKYKESLKSIKEKNGQLTAELQKTSSELENKSKEISQLQASTHHLTEVRQQVQELKDINEELQNKLNTYDFSKTKELSTFEIDLQKANEEILQLQSQITIFSKREEENAISLAENKLSIHKELESKEAEIKSLKYKLETSNNEVQSLNIIVNDYKKNINSLEAELKQLNTDLTDLNNIKKNILERDSEIQTLKQKCSSLEQLKSKIEEEYKCLELQVKQETAEKLAMKDRNEYLENRNKQISEENTKKSSQVVKLETEIQKLNEHISSQELEGSSKNNKEINLWKEKCKTLEAEMQDEREELIKLQTEIEKLLTNYNLLENENEELNTMINKMKAESNSVRDNMLQKYKKNTQSLVTLAKESERVKSIFIQIKKDVNNLKLNHIESISLIKNSIHQILSKCRLEHEVNHSTEEYDSLLIKHNELLKDLDSKDKQLHELINDIEQVKESNKEMQTQIMSSNTNRIDMCSQLESNTEDLNNLREENNILKSELLKSQISLKEAENKLVQNNEKIAVLMSEFEASKKDKQNINEQNAINQEQLKELKEAQDSINILTKSAQEKQTYTDTLQKNMKELIEENADLKSKIENILSNINSLEEDLVEVRTSHTDIVKEKDKLCEIIEKLESSKETLRNNETQTNEKNSELEQQLTDALNENSVLKLKCEQIKQEKEEIYDNLMKLENQHIKLSKDLEETEKLKQNCDYLNKEILSLRSDFETRQKEIDELKNINLDLTSRLVEVNSNDELCKNKFENLKEENRRLQSDIEGLQSYLTKISKENSVLNDKLREVIASSDTVEINTDDSVLMQEIAELKNEIEKEKGKCYDLVQQNNLLVEETLELKDQLETQSYEKPLNLPHVDEKQMLSLKDTCNNLMEIKSELENKLLESEVANNNIKSLQENNNKLRSTNEKLERRLDEALVSLRHLHSLQENTELEYLRNILYEYLTGSGTHSITLAKVLAAVVKFDDKQTEIVLNKEKERQGLLRQLGLL